MFSQPAFPSRHARLGNIDLVVQPLDLRQLHQPSFEWCIDPAAPSFALFPHTRIPQIWSGEMQPLSFRRHSLQLSSGVAAATCSGSRGSAGLRCLGDRSPWAVGAPRTSEYLGTRARRLRAALRARAHVSVDGRLSGRLDASRSRPSMFRSLLHSPIFSHGTTGYKGRIHNPGQHARSGVIPELAQATGFASSSRRRVR